MIATYNGIRALKDLEKRSKYYANRVRKFRQEQAIHYQKVAQFYLSKAILYPQFSTKKTKEGIKPYVTTTRIGIKATAESSMYVEYGTGIVGAEGVQNPKTPSNWEHDAMGHGEEGWTFYKPSAKRRLHTKGQSAKCFMYDTELEIRANLKKDFRKEFERCFKK